MKARLNIHLNMDDLPVDLSIKLAYSLNTGCRRLAEEKRFDSDGYPIQIYGIDHSSGRVCLNPTFRSENGHILLTGEVADVDLMPENASSCCDLYVNNKQLPEAEKTDLKKLSKLPWPALTIQTCVLFSGADRDFFNAQCDPERIYDVPDQITCPQMKYLIGTQVMMRNIEECIWLVNYWGGRKESAYVQ